MGGENKALLSLGSHRLIDLVYEALKPQTGSCALCLRTHKPWADALQLPILTDRPSSDRGPLGGIAAALAWGASISPAADWIITTAVDVPFIPQDLVERLTSAGKSADIAVAKSHGRVHRTIAAWRPRLASALDEAIRDQALPVHHFQSRTGCVEVEWPVLDVDPFFNINTAGDLETARRYTGFEPADPTSIGSS